jgi:polynucleotide 5'-kinase involved in rRNA processing
MIIVMSYDVIFLPSLVNIECFKLFVDPPPVLTVVGGKNSGKSTLNRFLVNSMLNKLVFKIY